MAQVDHAQLQKFTLSCNVSLARQAARASRRELPRELQALKKLPRPSSAGLEFDVELAQHTVVDVLLSGDAETEPGCDGMSEVRKTRKGEWWQVHGWSAAVVRCAAVMPPAERVGCHGPEELRRQLLRPANVVSERLAVDTRLIGVEVLKPQLRLVGCAPVCSLRVLCLRLSRRVAFALQRHWRHVSESNSAEGVMYENGSRTICSGFHRLHSESNINILLLGLWARPPVLSLVPSLANHNPQKNTGQKLLNNTAFKSKKRRIR